VLDSPYFAPATLGTAIVTLLVIQAWLWLRDRWTAPGWLVRTLPDDAEPDERLDTKEAHP
jgi:hypothetical protein